MDCQSCETLLLDLAYGELSPSAETEARVHLSRCAQCSSALARIESGLAFARRMPLMDAPSALSDRLMQAARRQVAMPVPVERVSPIQKWADFLMRFAMTRQVQMATVMLVIVVMGLWSVPQLTRKREAQGGTVINPENEGEAGPSAALSPATPLDLTVDPRTGRIRSKGEMNEAVARSRIDQAKVAQEGTDQPSVEGAAAPSAPAPAAAEPVAEPADEIALNDMKDEAAQNAMAESERADLGKGDRADMAAPEQDKNQETEAIVAQVAPRKEAAGMRADGFAQPPPAATRQASAEGRMAAAKPMNSAPVATDELMRNPYQGYGSGSGLGSVDSANVEKKSMPRREVSKSASAAAPSGGGSTAATYAQAMERYRAADYGSARSLFEGLISSGGAGGQTASALLYLARSERAQGRCDLAAAHYETVALRYSSTSEAAPALSEGVGCYDQLGDRSRADSLLVRATRVSVPVLAARAKQTLGERGTASTGTKSNPASQAAELPKAKSKK